MRYIVLLFIVAILVQGCNNNKAEDLTKYVNQHIGGVGHLLHPTYPVIHLPNQMIRMHPASLDYLDDRIRYFSLSMISHREGTLFGVLPLSGKISDSISNYQIYDHDLEEITPYYYKNYFVESDIKSEFTISEKSGMFRFSFPKTKDKCLKLHINNSGYWKSENPNTIIGIENFKGMKAYVYGEFDSDCSIKFNEEIEVNKRRNTQRTQANAWCSFDNETVKFRYSISFISFDQAKKNLSAEITDWNFEDLRSKANKKWNSRLGLIKVEGADEAQKKVFYTALSRYYERMVNINEQGKYYSAYDNKVHKAERDFYIDDWVWDSYVAQHPLRMILDPEQEADMLNSYVEMYKQSSWMPQFPLLFGDKAAMHGFHSTVVFLDAYRKGISNYNIEKSYEGLKKNADMATMLPWANGEKTQLDDFYRENGFFPALDRGEEEFEEKVHWFEKRQSVAITMAHSYDDWALGELANELHKTEDFNYYNSQSNNYKNLYNSQEKLMWPKNSSGNWIDIDPKFDGGPGGRDYYDENNGYTYAWQVQHDIPGLIDLMGGNEEFVRNLDNLFHEDLGRRKWQFWAKFPDSSGMVGQFSMGNELSFHIPYLYNYAGAPWKTQKRIRQLLDAWFQDSIFGIPGDEDGGAMSSFVVFSMMGFYPVTPGLPIYTIGSPVFEKTTIDLPNGRKFKIIAKNYSEKNKYIQSIKLNGKEYNKFWFSHDDILAGSTLELEMGEYPNKDLGLNVEYKININDSKD
ncbi:MAG: GH92 family glycosyl hydrolase [Bacteroidota bacterium]